MEVDTGIPADRDGQVSESGSMLSGNSGETSPAPSELGWGNETGSCDELFGGFDFSEFPQGFLDGFEGGGPSSGDL
jgi:hypothetical protein